MHGPVYTVRRNRPWSLPLVCVRVMEADEENGSRLVMQDIQGNELCVD